MAFQIIFVISFGKQKYRVAVRVPIYWVTSQTPVVLRAGPGTQAGSPTGSQGVSCLGQARRPGLLHRSQGSSCLSLTRYFPGETGWKLELGADAGLEPTYSIMECGSLNDNFTIRPNTHPKMIV